MPLADPSLFYSLHEGNHGLGVVPEQLGSLDNDGLLQGRAIPAEPVRFVYNLGSVPGDLIMCGSPDLLLISARLRSLLEIEGFSGWATYPVEATGRKGEPLPGYSGLSITGRAGPPHWEFSDRFMARAVPNGPLRWVRRGLLFDAASWDGSDFFLLGDKGYIVVTRAVQAALKAARIRNIRLEACSEYEVPEWIVM